MGDIRIRYGNTRRPGLEDFGERLGCLFWRQTGGRCDMALELFIHHYPYPQFSLAKKGFRGPYTRGVRGSLDGSPKTGVASLLEIILCARFLLYVRNRTRGPLGG